jgi:hypothetical protein
MDNCLPAIGANKSRHAPFTRAALYLLLSIGCFLFTQFMYSIQADIPALGNSELATDIESLLAMGKRPPLSFAPLDLIELLPSLPKNVAYDLFKQRYDLCLYGKSKDAEEEKRKTAKEFSKIKGIGGKRAELLANHFSLPLC